MFCKICGAEITPHDSVYDRKCSSCRKGKPVCNYRDLLDGQSCCRNCDHIIDFEDIDYRGIVFYYCPKKDDYVKESGYCDLYDGFFPKH